MKIISEKKFGRGSLRRRLNQIARNMIQLSKPNATLRGHIFTSKNGDIEGFALIDLSGKESVKLKPAFSDNGKRLDFQIQHEIFHSWKDWVDYIRMRNYATKKDLKGIQLGDKFSRLPRGFIPSIFLDNTNINDSNWVEELADSITLELGIYLAQREIVSACEFNQLFIQFANKYFNKTYTKIKYSEILLNNLPKVIGYWCQSKHSLGLKYHVGIYLQNILRKEKKKKYFSDEDFINEPIKKYLYYSNRRGTIRLSKKEGRYVFTAKQMALARHRKSEKDVKKALAERYAERKSISYKTAQRWMQRQTKNGKSLKDIYTSSSSTL
ncbi:MAG: hypothetical protein PHY73_05490 [Candidatus Omnitrophica bacterium]|nr:hypothetical protein [Candidatus Omnitrophota bacterium]